ncbi:cytochrome c biogenesis protein [Thermodesulfitimonas autotrophica]|uniref:Cytochrome c biogenesis protein n=1 Tax=Thermodesulfitimonas autotrophica TaxID=1894989 RepID=A0A3N5AC99_9THEO|nr:cytochrome c biogenesis protein ResB [Thermodesulfitimonas autotrophica]RPF42476.1 cytochrome c biogenesis protein [Thermodesulfitimonas autotrophica]
MRWVKIFTALKNHFTSIRAVLTVLAFLGIASAIGTLIPQNEENLLVYTERYGPNLGRLLIATGLTHVFRSWWFIAAEIWLVISLLVCTYYRGQFALRLSRRDAKRGLGAWGLTILHVSLILILVTLMATPRVSKEQRVAGAPGQIMALTAHGVPFDLQIKDFQIDYYPDGTPKQFRTQCAVLENGRAVREDTISVNHPLRYRGAKIYQMDYGWFLRGLLTTGGQTSPFEVVADRNPYPIDRQHLLLAVFYPDFAYDQNGNPVSQSQQPRNPYVLYVLYEYERPVKMGIVRVGQKEDVPGGNITFSGYALYTGLLVKRNPALPYTFAGFALATAGVIAYLIFNPRRRKPTQTENGGEPEA